MALRDVVSYLVTAQDQTRAATESAKRNLAELRTAYQGVQTSMRALSAAGLGFISVAGIKAGTSAIIDARVELERMKNTLTQGVGAGNVAGEMVFLRKAANDFGLSFTDVAASYAKFAAATKGTSLEGEETRKMFIAVSKASTVLGLSADQSARALNALQQMVSKGTVSAEELRGQLGEAIPGAFNLAARAMGVTTAALGEMLKQGELATEDLFPRLVQVIETEFAPGVERASQSASGSVNRLQTAWDALKETTATSPIGNAAFAGIDLLSKYLNALSDDISAVKLGLLTIIGTSTSALSIPDIDQLSKGLRTDPSSLGEASLRREGGTDPTGSLAAAADLKKQEDAARKATEAWDGLVKKHQTAKEKFVALEKEIRQKGLAAGATETEILKRIDAVRPKADKSVAREQAGIDREKLQAEISETRSILKSLETIYAGHRQELEATRAAGLASEESYYEEVKAILAKETQARIVALETESDSLRAAKATKKERIDLDRQIAENVAEVGRLMNASSSADTVLQIQQTASARKRTAAWEEARAAAQAYLDTATRAQQRELEGIGKGGNERDRLSGRSQIEDKYEGQRQQLESERRTGAFDNMPGEYDRQLALIEQFQGKALAGWERHYAARRALDQDAALGASEGLANYLDEASNTFKQTEDLVGGSLRSVEDAFVELARTGKVNFRSLIDDMLAQLARIAAQKLLVSIIGSVSGNTGFGTGSRFGNQDYGAFLSTGTNRVPYDGFRATLHKDEAVVPAKYNPAVGGMGGGGTTIVQNFNISGGGDGNDPQRLAAMVGDVAMARADEARRRRPGG